VLKVNRGSWKELGDWNPLPQHPGNSHTGPSISVFVFIRNVNELGTLLPFRKIFYQKHVSLITYVLFSVTFAFIDQFKWDCIHSGLYSDNFVFVFTTGHFSIYRLLREETYTIFPPLYNSWLSFQRLSERDRIKMIPETRRSITQPTV